MNKSWPKKKLIFLAQIPKDVVPCAKILKKLGWEINITASVPAVIDLLERNEIFLIVVFDNREAPAAFIAKQLIIHPKCLSTPIYMVLYSNSNADVLIMKSLSCFDGYIYPLEPQSFAKHFQFFEKKWETSAFQILRKLGYNFGKEKPEKIIDALWKISQLPEIEASATVILSYFLTQENEFREAENLLLHKIKNHPNVYLYYFALAQFYIQTNSPILALKALALLTKAFNNHYLVFLDIVQCQIVLNLTDPALETIEMIKQTGIKIPNLLEMQCCLLLSSGKVKEARKIMQHDPFSFDKINVSWSTITSQST